MIRNPYLWSVFRLILSLKSSKLRIFSLKPLIFKLKYIGFQERNRDVTIITHAFRTFKPCKKLWDKDWFTHIISRIWVFYRRLFLGFEYFSAIYFPDLSIFTIFAPVIQRVTIMTEYIHRNIDSELIAWKEDSMRKPLLLRGARQVGKSSAVKNLLNLLYYSCTIILTSNFKVWCKFKDCFLRIYSTCIRMCYLLWWVLIARIP